MTQPVKPSVRRVLVLGAESTGKTTLALALADHYAAPYVPEYFRTYWDGKRYARDSLTWTSDEFQHMAIAQCQLEDQLAKLASRQPPQLLICDTGALSTSLWHRRYLGAYSPAVDQLARARAYDLVLLSAHDMPFVQDGVRDGEHIRAAMTAWHQERLLDWSIPYQMLSGPATARVRQAVQLIEAL